MLNKNKTIIAFLHKLGIHSEYQNLIEIPNSVILASTVLSLSAISQWLVDLVLELFSLGGVIPKIPFRANFISLTFISAVLAWQTFTSLRKGNIKITSSALVVAFLVEFALVLGDLIFLFQNPNNLFLFWFRTPFIILTTINILIVFYVWIRLDLIHQEHKEQQSVGLFELIGLR